MEQGRVILSCSALFLTCTVAACHGTSDAPRQSAGGASGEAGSADNGGSQTSDSAQWPMPNSPGLGLPNPQSYDAESTPGVVHDLVTGLDWLQEPGTELYPRADAIDSCDALSLFGFDDWHAPAFIELVSLFDAVPNQSDPLAPVYLSPMLHAQGRFWSTSVVNESGVGRLLDFTADGCSSTALCSIGVAGKADEALGGAWCVRSSRQPETSARYQSLGGGVTDLRTGLTWLGVPAAVQTGAYADAVSACEALNDGARLPSINELLSILVPNLSSKAFPNWPSSAFAWSSSSIPMKPGAHWAAAIGGATRADEANNHNRVQCVR